MSCICFLHFSIDHSLFCSNWHFLPFDSGRTRLVLLLWYFKLICVSLWKLWHIWNLWKPYLTLGWSLWNLHFIFNKFHTTLAYCMQLTHFCWRFRELWGIIQMIRVYWNEMILNPILMLLLFGKHPFNYCSISRETLAQLSETSLSQAFDWIIDQHVLRCPGWSRRHPYISIELCIIAISRANCLVKHVIVGTSIHWNFISRRHYTLFMVNWVNLPLLLQRCLMSSHGCSSCWRSKTNNSLMFLVMRLADLRMIVEISLVHQAEGPRFLRIIVLISFDYLYIFKIMAPCRMTRCSLNLVEVRSRRDPLNRHYNPWLQLLIEKLINLGEITVLICCWSSQMRYVRWCSDSIMSQPYLGLRIWVK